MPEKRDYYQLLGIFRDASLEEIKRAYFDAAQRLHPDKNVAAGETEIFLEVQQAYEVLSNPKRRSLYDATLPPEIEANRDVKHETHFSRTSLVKIDEPQLLYTLLEISPREANSKTAATPPLNLCLVVDKSTSMQGEKMDMVKATAVQLMRSLRPEDVFSLVSFSDRAEVVVPAALGGDRKKLESRIHSMQPSGATEIFHGLQAGMREVQRTIDPSRINHIILLTDGHTYGDETACLELAEQAARQNIGITGMGIGSEWNDIFLDALASRTGSNASYISEPRDIQRLLVEKFNALLSTFADEVTLEFKPIEGIQINYAFRLQPEGGPILLKDNTLRLGPILHDAPLHILFEIIIDPAGINGESITLLDGLLRISIASRPVPSAPIRLRLTRDVQPDPSPEPPSPRIVAALSRLTLYRMQEKAHTAVEEGRFDDASRHLQNLATHLLAQGENALAKTALFEADSLEKRKTWSANGNKDIKYKTRALLLPAMSSKGTH